MKTKCDSTRKEDINQRGAALVTVVMISLLLLTASIAMLTAVGANSKNTTDILSETKAYYAAESGLQATINALRNDATVSYTYAVANPTLSAKLPYNWPVGSPTRAVIGEAPGTYTPNSGSAYSIVINDPDNTQVSNTFDTISFFYSGGEIVGGDPRVIDVPNTLAPDRTRITLTNSASTSVTFATATSNPQLATVRVENTGNGAALAIGTKIRFQIDYRLIAPVMPGGGGVAHLYGWLEPQVSNGPPVVLKFGSEIYSLSGGSIDPCPATTPFAPCPPFNLPPLNPGAAATPIFVHIIPVKPFRLRVESTGYGPNGAVKKLEGIIRRNLFNGLAPAAATTMLGPNCTPGPAPLDHCFEPGTSNGVEYLGGDCATGCVPSFGLTNQQYLDYVASHPPGGGVQNMQPPPAILDPASIPSWQQTPAAMESDIINVFRSAVQNDPSRYRPNGSNVANPGDWASGTGVTFCEGSCRVSGDGGGILIVTGKLTNVGGFRFKGTIYVVGEEGWERNGGGGGEVRGNVIIAAYYYRLSSYRIGNISSTFLPARYWITGGGASDIIYSDVSANYDNIPTLSDLMAGVAEK